MPKKKQPPHETKEITTKVSPSRQSKARLIKKNAETALPSHVKTGRTRGDAERAVTSSAPPPEALQARVANRAYELYRRRGGHHGQDLEDWFLAERQVLSEE